MARWLAADLAGHVQDLLLSPQSRVLAFLDARAVADLVATHASGKDNLSRHIWALMSLEMWLRDQAGTSISLG